MKQTLATQFPGNTVSQIVSNMSYLRQVSRVVAVLAGLQQARRRVGGPGGRRPHRGGGPVPHGQHRQQLRVLLHLVVLLLRMLLLLLKVLHLVAGRHGVLLNTGDKGKGGTGVRVGCMNIVL